MHRIRSNGLLSRRDKINIITIDIKSALFRIGHFRIIYKKVCTLFLCKRILLGPGYDRANFNF